jgi:hypothetical protein
MSFTRANPSPRYRELVELYRQMHLEGDRRLNLPPQQIFPGFNLRAEATRIKRLITATRATSILDYGSGKGKQYEGPLRLSDGTAYDTVQDYWDVDYVHCYDPSYPPFSTLPSGKFDGVVSTDVLEHCPEDDLEWIVDEMFGFATRFVFANVACFPALKRLPTGENAHCTVKPPGWWGALVRSVAGRHSGVAWEFSFEIHEDGPDGRKVSHAAVTSDWAAP